MFSVSNLTVYTNTSYSAEVKSLLLCEKLILFEGVLGSLAPQMAEVELDCQRFLNPIKGVVTYKMCTMSLRLSVGT